MEGGRWWQDGIGYICYPASFKDSDGDGVGDLKGILAKLPYLEELGVTFLWLCPIFDSPMEDDGYDVRDFHRINPLFGTMEDLRLLLKEAHARGIRILLDLVMNHTSREHPWFKKALQDPGSEERSYYIFRKGRKDGDRLLPPNNWGSFFSPSAWERVPGTDEFYFHSFGRGMPDLDWSNEKVRCLMAGIASSYLDMGVDGFRMDATAHLAKDMSFQDSPLPDEDGDGYVLDPSRFSNRPELMGYLQEFRRKALRGRDALLIGEVGGSIQPSEGERMARRGQGPLDLLFNFDTVWNNGNFGSIGKKDEEIRTDVMLLKHNFSRWYEACHETCDMPLYWCNHDHPRVLRQYGSREYRKESAKALLLTLLFLYGTPFLYQGEELGMDDLMDAPLEDFLHDAGTKEAVDSYRKEGYSEEEILSFLRRTGRTNARSPIPWDRGEWGGFSSHKPLFPMNHDHLLGVNVEEEEKDPDSVLNFYKEAIRIRKGPWGKIVREGRLEWVDWNHQDAMAYLHRGQRNLLVLTNMRPYDIYFTFNFQIGDILLHNYEGVLLSPERVMRLRPFESYLLAVR